MSFLNKTLIQKLKSLSGTFSQKESQGSCTDLEKKQNDIIRELSEEVKSLIKEKGVSVDLHHDVNVLKERNKKLQDILNEDVWFWQNDGGNDINSLSCPILINPDDLLSELKTLKSSVLDVVSKQCTEEFNKHKKNNETYVVCVGIRNEIKRDVKLLSNDTIESIKTLKH